MMCSSNRFAPELDSVVIGAASYRPVLATATHRLLSHPCPPCWSQLQARRSTRSLSSAFARPNIPFSMVRLSPRPLLSTKARAFPPPHGASKKPTFSEPDPDDDNLYYYRDNLSRPCGQHAGSRQCRRGICALADNDSLRESAFSGRRVCHGLGPCYRRR